MITTFRFHALRLSLPVLLAAAPASAQILLNDSFADGNRANEALPNSAAWYKGGGNNALLDITDGRLVFDRVSSGSHLLATAFAPTSGQTIGVGQVLTLNYTFSANAVPTGNSFNTDNRMGMYSYAANPSGRLTEDNSSANGPGTDVTGYMFTFHVSTTLAENPFGIYERTNTGASSLADSLGTFTSLGAVSVVPATGGLVSGQDYTLRFEIGRPAENQLSFTVSYFDALGNLMAQSSALDDSPSTFAFDSFIYRASSTTNKGGAHAISNVSIELGTIPEPGTYAMLVLGGLAAFAWRRRR